MSDMQTLVDMGFPKERAERALLVTNYNGVEPAMEWLLAHADEEIPNVPEQSAMRPAAPDNAGTTTTTTSTSTQVAITPTEQGVDVQSSSIEIDTANDLELSENPEVATSSHDSQEAKSLKCDECNRLFRTQMEVEFHAAKSGHSKFSESTEEKKPLTEDEKKEQLSKLEERIKQKRTEREEKEKLEALERERLRIKSGKDMLEARRKMDELEMLKIVEQRKREKDEEKAARDRVRAQIEADKAARKARMAAEIGVPLPVSIPTPIVAPAQTSTSPKPSKEYSITKIQIRLQDGSTLTETFDVKEQLSAVRLYIQIKQGTDIPFGLMTSFPRKIFSDDDYDKPLEVLGLVPSAVVIVTKTQ